MTMKSTSFFDLMLRFFFSDGKIEVSDILLCLPSHLVKTGIDRTRFLQGKPIN